MNAHAVASAPNYASQAQRLIALTALNQAMLTVAEAQQWGRLAELEEQRADVLAELFADAFYALDDAALIPVLTQTFAMNQRIMPLLEQAQQTCQGELTELNIGRRAQQAYDDNRG